MRFAFYAIAFGLCLVCLGCADYSKPVYAFNTNDYPIKISLFQQELAFEHSQGARNWQQILRDYPVAPHKVELLPQAASFLSYCYRMDAVDDRGNLIFRTVYMHADVPPRNRFYIYEQIGSKALEDQDRAKK